MQQNNVRCKNAGGILESERAAKRIAMINEIKKVIAYVFTFERRLANRKGWMCGNSPRAKSYVNRRIVITRTTVVG